MKKLSISIAALLVLSLLLPGQTPDTEENFRARYYENAKVVRVKHVEGEAFVDRSYDEGLEEATINLPVFEKDRLQTTDGRMEVYLGRLNYMRMDYDSDIILDKIPVLRHTSLTASISHGAVYLDINSLDYEKDIEIQTPDCGVFILGSGVFRINVTPERGTEIWVLEGLLEVAGTAYSRDVRSGQKAVFLDGRVRERPFYFRTAMTDDFDQWHESRDQLLGTARYGTSRYLDEGYSDYEYELSRNGRWVFSHTYNSNIWIPHRLMDGWRPYYNGRWVWHPHYGYVWNSYDRWGWFTHHYGRWHWDSVYGWHWLAGYRWSPAWVGWFWNDSYYGWAPLSYWNRPVIVLNRRWNRHFRYWRGIPIGSLSTVVIRKDRLLASKLNKYVINNHGGRFKVVKHTIPFRGNAPTLRPRWKTVRVMNAKGRNVIFKKSGLASLSRYRSNNQGIMVRKTTTSKSVIANKYSRGKTPKRISKKYESRTIQRRVIRNGGSSTGSATKKSTRYRSGKKATSSTSSGRRVTVRKKTTTRSRTIRKRSGTSQKSSNKKKAKRKSNSPSALGTAHYRAPSGAGDASAPSGRSVYRFISTSENEYRPTKYTRPRSAGKESGATVRQNTYSSIRTPYKSAITRHYSPRPRYTSSHYRYPRYSPTGSGAYTRSLQSPKPTRYGSSRGTRSYSPPPVYSKQVSSSSRSSYKSYRSSYRKSTSSRTIHRSTRSTSSGGSRHSARRRK